jgi:predicted flap endonuclease-1-like 5' DNA nuclease
MNSIFGPLPSQGARLGSLLVPEYQYWERKMSLLFKVLYAAHARGTHHKLALDALQALDVPDRDRWVRLFLKHAETFMTGAKTPDDVFKDFKNHVLHPRDGFWGGAPAAARDWYGKTVAALEASDWPAAANAAGILSHYVTDPVQPFHTGQSEAESSIHRAFEWSTAKSYADLVAIAIAAADPSPGIAVPERDDWLEEMLRTAALHANKFYEKCLAHYDINQGVVDPPAGLDAVSRRVIGNQIRYASALFAIVLSRAILEAKVSPPDVELGLDTVLATLKIPMKTLANRLADRADRDQVQRMYDELKATGTVEANLPEDDRAVRDLHAAEVVAAAQPRKPSAAPKAAAAPAKTASPAPKPAPKPSLAARLESVQAEHTPIPAAPKLKPADNVVDAPSIGPRMADRLHARGIDTVADLLAGDAASLAAELGLSHVKKKDVADWQAQARLASTIPGLTGTGAQLIVGAGYRDLAAIVAVPPAKLAADVLAYAASASGKRILRDGTPPDTERIETWAANTRQALAA